MEEEGRELGLKSISLAMFTNKGKKDREEVKQVQMCWDEQKAGPFAAWKLPHPELKGSHTASCAHRLLEGDISQAECYQELAHPGLCVYGS